MIWIQILLSVVGIAAVLWGADKFTDGAGSLAARLKVPQMVIGLTVVAFGTSAPEFFISLVSALQDKSGMAIGNVVGSCVFNIFFVLGVCSLVRPMEVSDISLVQLSALVASGLLVWLFTATKTSINRIEGIVMCLCYIAFITYLVLE